MECSTHWEKAVYNFGGKDRTKETNRKRYTWVYNIKTDLEKWDRV
jgi:hypothetical protein